MLIPALKKRLYDLQHLRRHRVHGHIDKIHHRFVRVRAQLRLLLEILLRIGVVVFHTDVASRCLNIPR